MPICSDSIFEWGTEVVEGYSTGHDGSMGGNVITVGVHASRTFRLGGITKFGVGLRSNLR